MRRFSWGADFFMRVIFRSRKQDLIDQGDPLILYTGGGTPLRAGAGTLKQLSYVPARTGRGHLLKCPPDCLIRPLTLQRRMPQVREPVRTNALQRHSQRRWDHPLSLPCQRCTRRAPCRQGSSGGRRLGRSTSRKPQPWWGSQCVG